jgi:lipid-binding SYLF domain-containing protein
MKIGRRWTLTMLFAVLVLPLLLCGRPDVSHAASAEEIEIGVNGTLKRFRQEITGGAEFLSKATGVLVFPNVLKAGFGIGGEYGEGALRINGKTEAYYNTAAASIGLQLGAQSKSIVIVFLTQKAINDFRTSDGWKAGVDGSVALVEWGVGEDINTIDIKDPIVGFVFSNKGLMYNLTLEGAKFTRITR